MEGCIGMKDIEINSLIAEKIMGWKHTESKLGDGWMDERGLFPHRVNCWDPMFNIKHAMDVVEKLKHDFVVQLEIAEDGYGCTIFNESESGEHLFSACNREGVTLQEAICQIALVVIESKEDLKKMGE